MTGDRVFVVILGTSIPFTVKSTDPLGIVLVDVSTRVYVHSGPDRPPEDLYARMQAPFILAICLDGPKTTSAS